MVLGLHVQSSPSKSAEKLRGTCTFPALKIVAQGSEVGIHAFSSLKMVSLPFARLQWWSYSSSLMIALILENRLSSMCKLDPHPLNDRNIIVQTEAEQVVKIPCQLLIKHLASHGYRANSSASSSSSCGTPPCDGSTSMSVTYFVFTQLQYLPSR